MYLFSTINSNTNFILNKEKEYKELVYMAEKELNLELDSIKSGDFSKNNLIKNKSNSENITINKSINLIDKSRGIYMVTVDAKNDDENIRLQGYERANAVSEGEVIIE